MSNEMALGAGTRIGPYEIVGLLGVGGMGEVYRSRDTKLNREVAVKVLLAAVANDAERLARFSREAQLIASINHPNIAQIHGLEDAGGIRALVMELVEGPTLADRIAREAIPLEEALPIAKQIAEALEAAHDLGIIHRDLKPANVKIRADGTVKVLDFGLAKVLDPAGATSSEAANSPTLSMQATAAGVILGTAAYMAPEQARGKAVDKRADIWAFGCVLFEMLTGTRAFQGDDITDTIVAVVSKEPDWTALPASASGVRPLLVRCLKKDRRQRLQAIGDARIQIHELISGTSDDGARPLAPVLTTSRRAAPVAVAALAAAGMAALVTWSLTRSAPPASPAPTRFSISLPATESLAYSYNAADVALSSDGRHLVYSAGPQAQLMVRALDQLEARSMPGITNARTPFLSPDGQWIGFFDRRGELRKVSMAGGSAVTISRVTGTSRGATWLPDDTIVFATSERSSGLLRVAAGGGKPTELTALDSASGERGHYFPSASPDGHVLLFTVALGDVVDPNVVALDLRTGRRKTIIRGGSQAKYLETGHVVYVVANTLWAVAFDPVKLETSGDPVPVVERLKATFGGRVGGGNFSISRHGTLVYVPQNEGGARELVWVDRSGTQEAATAQPGFYYQPRLSRDSKRIAVTIDDQGNNDIFTLDLARGTRTRLTFEASGEMYPVWMPDGQSIIYSSARNGSQNLYRRASDGTGLETRLTTSVNSQRSTSISPDGTHLVFEENAPKTAWDLGMLTLDGAMRATSFVQLQFDERNPEISPDGRWLAYESNESGQEQVYVRPFPAGDALFQISSEGGRTPAWAPNGGELFFAEGNSLMAVPVSSKGSFIHGNATKLFEGLSLVFDARAASSGPKTPGGAYRMYDVSPDGKRFLMVREVASRPSSAPVSMVVVLNWFEEVKAKLTSQ